MNKKCMVKLQGNEIETTFTCQDPVVDEWILCIGTKCLLYKPLYFESDPPRLLWTLFRNPKYIFVGVDFDEKKKTTKDVSLDPQVFIDIEDLAVERWCWPKQHIKWKPGLKLLANFFADLDIKERPRYFSPFSNQRGSKELSIERIENACIEVYASC
ncbi:hypothetical protein POM88_008607 [Heracleum sosnowskyi]|uniref:Uncharacterized protein n=1 Tax=Heracleum sosnowskyi TaxID=360622 RepID=A0AAD8J8A9_9APIA|nr:hypothetical protein POM88_008607 [Heracleum sosnowskyi]